MNRATAPGQLEGHELAEAGGAQVLVQHGLGEALVLVQEAQVQDHAIQQVAPGSRVERAAWPVQLHRPGAPALHGSSCSASGSYSSMVMMPSLRPHLHAAVKRRWCKLGGAWAATAAVALAVAEMGQWGHSEPHLLLLLVAAAGLACQVLVCLHRRLPGC